MKRLTNPLFLASLVSAGVAVSASGCGKKFTCEDSLTCDSNPGGSSGDGDGDGDATGGNGGQGGEMNVMPPELATLEFTTGSLPAASFNAEYSFQLEATGEGAVTISVKQSTLPAGVTLSDDGVLSGIPTESGTFELRVVARFARA